ncbi:MULTISPECIES: SAVED domain-containing protein [Streptomyces]|uniref:SAVED domain-containing protein n=1 Tax=Streptomyces TaxID=1883 RepID=UPI0029BE6123|nr:SAVED domain-containing protein [Streptomyces sp. AK02-04a]MDX3760106.1 SAVED domain-containing protein [Streptomyces sp. AK02-04a]
MEPLPAPSPTSVRIAGDHYQWLVAWEGCLALLRENAARSENPVVSVGVELDGVGNLDDVVLLRRRPPHTYTQVKYTVDSSTPVNEEYLTKPSKDGGPSVLKKIAKAWRTLTADGMPADLVLSTNRAPDPADPLVAVRDSRSQLLMPKAGLRGPRSALGAARARWAAAAGLSEDELRELLSLLRFDLARDQTHVQQRLELLMAVAGLRHDEHAVASGADWVAKQVRAGHRTLTLDMVKAAVDSLGLKAGPARAVLSIATLKPDPVADDADYAIDWVDRFDGPDDFTKRRPLHPATWAQLQTDIEAAPAHLPLGTAAISITGSIRLAPAFLTGAAFRMVTGADLAVLQRGQLWSTSEPYNAPQPPTIQEHSLDQGDELAVAIAVATDPTEDVLDYLREQQTPVSKLLVLTPPGGAKDRSIPDSAAANALAIGIRDVVRRATRTASRIHLFIAGPMGLALLLGHRWNRLRPTVVYEDVRTAQGYEVAFTIQA